MRKSGLKLRVIVTLALSALVAALAPAGWANVTVPSIIGDHMVLQNGAAIPVWGKADPGEAVTVTLGKQVKKTVTAQDGKWMVKLGRVKAASAPLEMTIAGKGNTISVKDILVGEVWIGSGQSNMEWPMKAINNSAQEIAAANYPEIRLFTVKKNVAAEPQDNCEGVWNVCTPATVPDFSAVLFLFGRDLHKELNTPMGLINTSWGGTPAESWTSSQTLNNTPDYKPYLDFWKAVVTDYPAKKEAFDKALVEWNAAAEKAKAEGKPEPKDKPSAPWNPGPSWQPAGLYNAMIMPIVPFPIKGAVWYQGESNAGSAYAYRKLFPAMITDWRNAWGGKPFSFYYVQLANFMERKPEPDGSGWAELREAQNITLSLKNTGQAVIIDIGDAKDIHPKNKQDVGKRLALNALSKDYHKRVVYSGPTYKSMKIKGKEIILSFKDTKGGLIAKGGTLKSFAIAGADQKFVWADAMIKGKKIYVSSDKVAAPVAVRYAWADNPECSLYNGAGLPASPFRTDTFTGVTQPK